ncbi:MAG: FeoA family protein [Candidatus Omnitrophica bacterium]|nr:FeoA family protein [Candidatus Omnitrophota bacterium]MDD5653296.1 FeoA family protein [Candidatus Omnitrophota bacterium]
MPGAIDHEGIVSLVELKIKKKGKVAYLRAKDRHQMQKLIAIGALPGTAIVLLQKFPSYVFELGHSQFAVDKELAQAIFVKVSK